MRASKPLTEMARYSLAVFETFAHDIDHDIQFQQVGSLTKGFNMQLNNTSEACK